MSSVVRKHWNWTLNKVTSFDEFYFLLNNVCIIFLEKLWHLWENNSGLSHILLGNTPVIHVEGDLLCITNYWRFWSATSLWCQLFYLFQITQSTNNSTKGNQQFISKLIYCLLKHKCRFWSFLRSSFIAPSALLILCSVFFYWMHSYFTKSTSLTLFWHLPFTIYTAL